MIGEELTNERRLPGREPAGWHVDITRTHVVLNTEGVAFNTRSAEGQEQLQSKKLIKDQPSSSRRHVAEFGRRVNTAKGDRSIDEVVSLT